MLIREGLSSQQEPGLPPQECRFGTGPGQDKYRGQAGGKVYDPAACPRDDKGGSAADPFPRLGLDDPQGL